MKLLNFISFLLFFSFTAVDGFTQSSAQATMEVRVEVISAAGIVAIQPKLVRFLEEKENTFARLTFSGTKPQDLLINFSKNLLLKNEEGDQTNLSVLGSLQETSTGTSAIELKGLSSKKLLKGIYTGILTATVEYF